MFKPQFNKVLVEIDDKEAKWGSGNDESILGASYREGKVIELSSSIFRTNEQPSINTDIVVANLEDMIGKTIMWHEGTEAGTIFEENGKKYGLIYWFDIIGLKE